MYNMLIIMVFGGTQVGPSAKQRLDFFATASNRPIFMMRFLFDHCQVFLKGLIAK